MRAAGGSEREKSEQSFFFYCACLYFHHHHHHYHPESESATATSDIHTVFLFIWQQEVASDIINSSVCVCVSQKKPTAVENVKTTLIADINKREFFYTLL